MTIQAINAAEQSSVKQFKKNAENNVSVKNAQPSFQGIEQVPVAVADALYNGGFITSFIAQDFFGMAGPRVLEGINRRPVNPETGKKEGSYNWAFARREGIREILSGPSAFIIPAFLLHFIKKYSGTANNVPINMIQSLGNNFIDYASENASTLDDVAKTKTEFYEKIFKNVLNTSLEGNLPEEELVKLSKQYADRAIEIELSKDKKKSLWKKITNQKVKGSPDDLTDSLLNDFMKLKKKYLNPSVNELAAEISFKTQKFDKAQNKTIITENKTGVGFKKLLKTMTDFTDDVIETTGNAMKKVNDGSFDTDKFLKSFVARRTGSRILSNLGMWGAVVAFYAYIPKLYSLGLKGQNPAFAHENKLKEEEAKKKALSMTGTKNAPQNEQKSDVAFTGKEKIFENTAEYVLDSNKLKNIINHFEFNDASMSVSAMLALLYGFCLPTRLYNAPDKYDRNETIARDVTSFGAILFAANALSRGFSKVFSKLSGLALNITPSDHNKNLYTRFRDYFSPMSGINVLSNKELESKYTNVHKYKNGILDFFDFITGNGGNLKKTLQIDKEIAENAKIILGKDIKDVVDDNEIKEAFKNIKTDAEKEAKQTIENILKDSKNKLVKHSKTYNSMFTFLSTIVLVPGFMIWLARTCDKMTRKARARDKALENKNTDSVEISAKIANNNVNPTKISMQGFLDK